MDTISQYLNNIYKLERAGHKYDLKNIALLLEATGNPHDAQSYIHIAGTNGKGGISSFLASILQEHGLKTGLFTSPHILRFNERIRVNGKGIPNYFIKDYIRKNIKLIKKIKASFFEVNTALALKYFAVRKTDVAVIETGLGGRLDATNIIKPELIIITRLALEHTDILGHTLRKIAKEKIGIVKPNVDIIVSDDNADLRSLFAQHIEREHLIFIDDIIDISVLTSNYKDSIFNFSIDNNSVYFKLKSPLPGKYQMRNAATAILASLKYLSIKGLHYNGRQIRKGIKNVIHNSGYHGRFESFKSGGNIYILDVAHNPDAIHNSLTNLNGQKVAAIVFGIMKDKDYKSIIQDIIKYSDNLIFTKPISKRSREPGTLHKYAQKYLMDIQKCGVSKQLYTTYNVTDSLELAKRIAGDRDKILIIGSFFLVSEAVKILKLSNYFI
jgi:dihydrofolate synthase/folylpolyglutamate synthase